MNKLDLKPLQITSLFLLLVIICNAQKLPSVQQGSFRAPQNARADGKANEWNNQFQAHNGAIGIYYTIANDDDNLYFIARASDLYTIRKITAKGLIFTIYKPVKESIIHDISITYTVYDKNNKPGIQLTNIPRIISGSASSILLADSFMKANNKHLSDKTKYIQITGAKGLDSLISIYNEDGIKAAQLFDNKMVYTLEIEIPLKYLNLTADIKEFNYDITIPGITSMNDIAPGVTRTKNADGIMVVTVPDNAPIYSKEEMPILFSSTNLRGKYLLVKK